MPAVSNLLENNLYREIPESLSFSAIVFVRLAVWIKKLVTHLKYCNILVINNKKNCTVPTSHGNLRNSRITSSKIFQAALEIVKKSSIPKICNDVSNSACIMGVDV